MHRLAPPDRRAAALGPVLGICLVLVAAAMLPAPVAAQSQSDTDSQDSIAEIVVTDPGVGFAVAQGEIQALQTTIAKWQDAVPFIGGPGPNTSTEARNIRAWVNQHDAALVSHTNRVIDHYNGTVYNTTYVLKVTVVNTDDDVNAEETVYVIAEGNGTAITSASAVSNTSKTVDRSITLDRYEADALNSDLRSYYDAYVQPNEVPPLGYYVRHGAAYAEISELRLQRQIGAGSVS